MLSTVALYLGGWAFLYPFLIGTEVTWSLLFLFLGSSIVTFGGGMVYLHWWHRMETKRQMRRLTTYFTILRRGKWQERLAVEVDTYWGEIHNVSNEFASYVESQLETLKRVATEKEQFAKEAESAAVLKERQRIARELHDSISQKLFAIMMLSTGANKANKDLQLQSHLLDIETGARSAQQDMRALLLHLRPIELENESLSEGLLQIAREFQQKYRYKVRGEIDELTNVSSTVESHLFRIAQESLANILRHADAETITIRLQDDEKEITLYIADDGQGFERERVKKTSYGLETMKERANEMGALLSIHSSIGKGTYIQVRIRKKQEAVVS